MCFRLVFAVEVKYMLLRNRYKSGSFAYVCLGVLDLYKRVKKVLMVDSSMVKWTALDPCSGLSDSVPKLYTNFEFYEIEIHKHLNNVYLF